MPSIRSVTRKPPTTLRVPKAMAMTRMTESSSRGLPEPPQDDDAAEQHDAVDGVGARHQRGVQGVGHLGDDGESDERGQDEDREVREQASGLHHADSSSSRDAGRGKDLVGPVGREGALVVQHEFQQRGDVACVELRGVLGHAGGRLSGAATVTSWRTTVVPPGRVSSQFPPLSPARSTTTLPGRIPSTAAAVTSIGARAAGHQGRRDHDVERGDRLVESLLLPARSSAVSSRA